MITNHGANFTIFGEVGIYEIGQRCGTETVHIDAGCIGKSAAKSNHRLIAFGGVDNDRVEAAN